MKSYVRLTLIVAGCLPLASCSLFPTTPSGPNPYGGGGGSTSITYATPEIEASIAMQGGIANTAQVLLDTDTQAVVDAAVTLTGPSAFSMPLTFNYSSSGGGYYLAYYNSPIAWNYVANQPYTMTISYGGYTFKSSVTTVGNVVFTPGGSSLSISWVGGGNENSVLAIGSGDFTATGVSSPYVLQNSSLTSYTAGSYDVEMSAEEIKTGAFPGAYQGSFFSAADQESTTY